MPVIYYFTRRSGTVTLAALVLTALQPASSKAQRAPIPQNGYPSRSLQAVLLRPDYGQYNRVTYTHGAYIAPFNPGQNWRVAAVADMDQDGQPDILFQNSATGDLYVWFMEGATMRAGRYFTPSNPEVDWKLSEIADLNGDGQLDLLFQNQRSGMLAYWLMRGTREVEIGVFNPNGSGGPDWLLVAPK